MDIENDLKIIWQKQEFIDFCKLPFIYPVIEQHKDLLFIGINPSFNEADLVINSYTIKEERHKLNYFNTFNNFAIDVNASWTHIDLLFFRETNQKHIETILKLENGPAFLQNQLQVADELIKYANPKIIIVCNALARKFLGREKAIDKHGKEVNVWLGYDFVFNDDIGTYLWNNMPVFFSSMLSGQRALDKGSLERLLWQVKRTLQILKQKQ